MTSNKVRQWIEEKYYSGITRRSKSTMEAALNGMLCFTWQMLDNVVNMIHAVVPGTPEAIDHAYDEANTQIELLTLNVMNGLSPSPERVGGNYALFSKFKQLWFGKYTVNEDNIIQDPELLSWAANLFPAKYEVNPDVAQAVDGEPVVEDHTVAAAALASLVARTEVD
ncbi:hypothetical protein BKA62DRAFT_677926 [Auriculariales sp. MPI-PUGE-AT-0066]|nr:hypothetical protein BKA62DRAFT_677926 [Auriculariales sp. MPI-PUGE-AT-0066]